MGVFGTCPSLVKRPKIRNYLTKSISAKWDRSTGTHLIIDKQSNVFWGILSVLGASFAFTLNDVGIKFLSGDYALHQIVLFRATVAILFTLAIFVPLEGGYQNLKTNRIGLHLFRGFMIVLANMTFFAGLASLSLPTATALFFVAPLFITALSALLLGENVGIRRWLAVVAGLTGVVVMMRPGADAFNLTALLPVAAAFFYAATQIMTRKMGLSEKASTMAFYIQLTFILVSSVVGLGLGDGSFSGSENPSLEFLTRKWFWPPLGDLIIMTGIGCMSATGGYLISQAYRLCEAAFVAPFEYCALPIAIVWSVVFFGEWPDGVTWLGIAFIAGAGLFILWREKAKDTKVVARRPMPRHR